MYVFQPNQSINQSINLIYNRTQHNVNRAHAHNDSVGFHCDYGTLSYIYWLYLLYD